MWENVDSESINYLKIVRYNENVRPFYSKLYTVTGTLIGLCKVAWAQREVGTGKTSAKVLYYYRCDMV